MKTTLSLALTAGLSLSAYALERAPLQTGYVYDFGSDIDDGGEISNHFFHLTGGLPLYKNEEVFVALSASYHLHDYQFSDGPVGSIASLDPWDQVHTANLGLYFQWQVNDDWEVFAIPNVRTSGESGADFGDTLTGGALLGASYRFSDRLSIGPGLGYVGQLEDSASIFPILVIDWKITDSISLSTGSIVGASLGPGLAIKWDIDEKLRFTLTARSERRRFRLDDALGGAGDQAIGEDNSVPVFGVLTYQATEHLQTSLIAGVGVANDIVLDDANGNRLSRQDYDPAPFLGFNLGYNF